MRFILLGLVCSHSMWAAEIPTLRFDDRVTWKQIFDFGFRPKHLEGLERNTCVSQNQSFWVEFKGRESKFKIQNGRVSFSFLYDDFLSMVWHQESEAITLEDGKQRADEFRKVFDGYIVKEITMPPLIDPSGLVDAGNAENNIEARIGEYVIWYGFDNSMRKDKPIVPHFYIAWSFPGKPDSRTKDSGDVVRSPRGYEWYSLDPNVSTPDPGSTPVALPEPEAKVPEKKSPDLPKVEAENKLPEKPKALTDESQIGWWVIRILGFITAAVLFWRWKSKPTP